jgi:catechol 2,3-dioxygenase-like lactoylglutathione lyase family enzyme
MRNIGVLSQVTIAVEDVAAGQDFWSKITGLPVARQDLDAGWADLEPAPVTSAGPVVALRRATMPKPGPSPNRGHVDITVDDVDTAIDRVTSLGGRLKVGPALYPRPMSEADGLPVIDWAVMTDPFDNEFCIIRDLEREEQAALRDTSRWEELVTDATRGQRTLAARWDDAEWRKIAREARSPSDRPSVESENVSRPSVGELRCCVINVEDLAVALQFWSALISVEPIVSEWPFRFGYLGYEHEVPELWRHQMILQRSSDAARDEADRVHYDITVDDLGEAAGQVRWMGGIPGATSSERLLLAMHAHDDTERLVMRDRSGNSFCLAQRNQWAASDSFTKPSANNA